MLSQPRRNETIQEQLYSLRNNLRFRNANQRRASQLAHAYATDIREARSSTWKQVATERNTTTSPDGVFSTLPLRRRVKKSSNSPRLAVKVNPTVLRGVFLYVIF